MHRRTADSPRLLLCLLLTLLVGVGATQAADGIRIAVADFDTTAVRHNWRYSWSYQNLERAAADNLATKLVQSGEFRVIERQQLEHVLAEQDLGESWRTDPSTAARVGKLLGAQLIVVGSVTEFGIKEKGAKIPQIGKWKWGRGVGGKMVTGKSTLTARLVDTTTGEILGAYEGSGSSSFGSAEFAGAKGGTKWDSGLASKVLGEAVERLANDMSRDAQQLEPSTQRGGIEGKIAKAGSGKVFLNLGSSSGVKVGDKFKVTAIGEEILDPDTGESLGGVETEVGVVEITKIVNERLSEARIVDGDGFAVGNRAVMQ